MDHDYKGLGTYFSVLNPEGPGCTTAEVITLFEIDSHYIFDNVGRGHKSHFFFWVCSTRCDFDFVFPFAHIAGHSSSSRQRLQVAQQCSSHLLAPAVCVFSQMFALADAAAENPLEAPLQFEQFAKVGVVYQSQTAAYLPRAPVADLVASCSMSQPHARLHARLTTRIPQVLMTMTLMGAGKSESVLSASNTSCFCTQCTQLWTFSEADGHQFVIESKKASTRHLPKGFALVGAQLKKTAEGRAILSGLDGQE